MSFKIIGWFTIDTPYQDIIKQYLLPSLKKISINKKINYDIYPIESTKNWKSNTNLKPIIAERALKESNENILLLDADCRVNDYPSLFDEIPEEYDIACFYLDWNEWYKNNSDKIELCSGTLFFRNRQICLDLIESWKVEGLKESNKLTDQEVLHNVLRDFPEIKIYSLPYEYCWINSLPRGGKPHIQRPSKVIIEHYQSSREMRSQIK